MATGWNRLLFGTGGVPRSARGTSTEAGIERIRELGLAAMEVEFVQGVRMREPAARAVAQVAAHTGVCLSVHAPYFINLNAREPEKVQASQQRLLQAARIGHILGARTVNFHAAFYMKDDPRQVYQVVKQRLQEVVRQLREEGNHCWLRPEITGKHTEFGTLEEVLDLSAEVKGVLPTIDVAHWHARTGATNTYDEFIGILRQVEARLGRSALEDMHFHCSGIKYSQAGELSHLNLQDSDLHYREFLQALKDLEVKGMVICESPDLEGDALLMQRTYHAL